ncbi:MAG: DUF4124 domain-containing protein, partial [Alcanivoracaceae bacterium]|nr:DUF4124 domain-containing protein [Alcanivoracaceae bacterium]
MEFLGVKNMKKAVLMLLLLASASSSTAEIYKWTDENGKVHFSDKVKHGDAEALAKEDKENEADFETEQKADRLPLIRPYTSPARKVYLSSVNYQWKNDAAQGKSAEIGILKTRSSCHKIGSITVPEYYVSHPDFFPSEDAMAGIVSQAIRSLDYNSSQVSASSIIKKARDDGALHLQPTISRLYIDACAPNSRAMRVSDTSAGSYSRVTAKLEITWTLTDALTSQPVWTGTTSGSADSGGARRGVYAVLGDAIKSATLTLMSDPEFVGHLVIGSTIGTSMDFSSENTATNYQAQSRDPWRQTYGLRLESSPVSFSNPRITELDVTLAFGPTCSTTRKLSQSEARQYERRIPISSAFGQSIRDTLVDLRYSVAFGFSTAYRGLPREFRHITITPTHFTMVQCYTDLPEQAKFREPSSFSNKYGNIHLTMDYKWAVSRESGQVIASGQDRVAAGETLHNSRNLVHTSLLADQVAASLSVNPDFLDAVTRLTVNQEAAENFPYKASARLPAPPADAELLKILVPHGSLLQMFEQASLQQRGYAFAGSPCQAVDAVDAPWPERGPWYYPSEQEIFDTVLSAISETGLSLTSESSSPAEDAPVLIRPRLLDMRYDICSPILQPHEVQHAGFSLAEQFTNGRAYVSIEWEFVN